MKKFQLTFNLYFKNGSNDDIDEVMHTKVNGKPRYKIFVQYIKLAIGGTFSNVRYSNKTVVVDFLYSYRYTLEEIKLRLGSESFRCYFYEFYKVIEYDTDLIEYIDSYDVKFLEDVDYTKRFRITFELYFKQTYSGRSFGIDYGVDIDKFMTAENYRDEGAKPRYVFLAEEALGFDDFTIDKVEYQNGGIVTCDCSIDSIEMTANALKEWLETDSLEDGAYEGEPGSALVYPIGFLTYGKDKPFTKELGLIDYRDSVKVRKLK